jgi:predicted dehydrogenase
MLKVGLIGCGFMGRMHGEVYGVLPSVELVAAFDKRPDAAELVAKPHHAKVVRDFEALLSDSSIDYIDVCLPTHLHSQFTVAALKAGKHVICEKPMALNADEAQAMIDASRSSGKTLMIAHCIRFWPEYAILKGLVDDCKLGKLLSVNMTRFGAFPSWSSDNWLAHEDLSGGGALDMHIHDTDFAQYLLGEPDSIASWGTLDDRGVGQIFSTMTWGKAIGHLQGGWNLPSNAPFRMAFRAIFERGLANFDAGVLTIYEEGKDPVVPPVTRMSSAGQGGNISDLGGYFFELEYFADRLSKGLPTDQVTPESSLASLRIALEEIRQAKQRNGTAVA